MPEILASIDYTPRPWALDVHRGIAAHRFWVIVAHRGSGKSYLAAHQLAIEAMEHDDSVQGPNGRYLFISPFLKQARDVVWAYLKSATRNVPGVEYQESALQVRLPNGAWVCLYGADNPDALRGMHPHGVVMDECKDMKPEVWGEIVRPMLTSHEAWCGFIGTAKGINLMSQMYYHAVADPLWFAGLYDVDRTNVLSPDEIDLARKTMTPRQFAAEMMCDFSAGSDSTLIALDIARNATRRFARVDQYQHAPRLMGVDAARYGDDRTAIVMRQGIFMSQPVTYRGLDTGEVISRIVRTAETYNPHAIFVDVGGNAGVYDGIKKMRWPVHAVDFGSSPVDRRFQNKRAEMWVAMRDWLKDGGIIPDNQELLADLCSTEYDYHNTRGKFSLESKEDMRARGMASPDIADALACTFAFPIAAPQTSFYIPPNKRLNDWNPLDPEYL